MPALVAADILEGEITTRRLLVALAIAFGGLVVGTIARRVVRRVLSRGADRERVPVDATAASLVARIAQAVVVAFAVVYALYALGVQVGPLFAALGIGGIAVAFALRDTLENLIAGLVLQLRRPFVLGDRVTLGANDGTVVDVGFRYVQLARLDGTVALLPARRVLDDAVVNHSGNHPRRSTATIAVPSGAAVAAAREAVLAAVADAPHVLESPAPQVLLSSSADGDPQLLVRCWHDPSATTGDQALDAVLERAWQALAAMAE